MGILRSALTPYDNDLYASNLAHVPILAIHGSDDDNVPTWHSREHVALVQAWTKQTQTLSITLLEVPKKGHWWDDILKLEEVNRFIDALPTKVTMEQDRSRGFTLTTANPQESGGRAGIRIVELDIPGRLARLDVNMPQWSEGSKSGEARATTFHGMNVKRFSIVADGQEAVMMKGQRGFQVSAIAIVAGPC
jgi:hypothetical protein